VVADSLGGWASLPKGSLHHRSSLALALFVVKPSPLLFPPPSTALVVRVCLSRPRFSSLALPPAALAVPAVRPHHLPSAGRRKEHAGGRWAEGALFGSSGQAIFLGKARQKAASRVMCVS
jgi:hypothetical protein